MDNRAAIIATSWIAIAVISAMYLYKGGVNFWTYTAVGLLVIVATAITFGLAFGLEGMHRYGPPSRSEFEISTELKDMKAAVDELTKKVDAIQKELQE